MSKSTSMESDKILRYSVIQSISNFEYRISMEPEKAYGVVVQYDLDIILIQYEHILFTEVGR